MNQQLENNEKRKLEEFLQEFEEARQLAAAGEIAPALRYLNQLRQQVPVYFPDHELLSKIEALHSQLTYRELENYDQMFSIARELANRQDFQASLEYVDALRDRVIEQPTLFDSTARGRYLDMRYALDHFRNELLDRIETQKREAAISQAGAFVLQTEQDGLPRSLQQHLTPVYLGREVIPYLDSIAEIQRIIDDIFRRPPREVKVKIISQNSPISVSMEGASQAIELVRDTITPWRRKHAQEMARLSEAEKQAEIESKKAEILEKRARAQKERAEVEKIAAEVVQQREMAEKARLENEKLRVELQREKIQLAIDIVAKVAPNLSEKEKIAYIVRLLPPVEVLALSELSVAE